LKPLVNKIGRNIRCLEGELVRQCPLPFVHSHATVWENMWGEAKKWGALPLLASRVLSRSPAVTETAMVCFYRSEQAERLPGSSESKRMAVDATLAWAAPARFR